MYLLYSVLLAVAFVLSAPFYLWKGRGTGKYLRTLADRMGRPSADQPAGGPSIWIHAVSVGEVLAARVLVRPLKARFPGHRVYVSTTTLTGNAVARETVRGADGVLFAPFDFQGPVTRVLDRLHPALLVLVETEIWPNLIHLARRRGVRIAVVNGRISPRSFPRYRRARTLLRRVLAEVDLFLMQGDAHRARMLEMGAPPERVRVTGNLKYDALGDPAAPEALRRALGQDGPGSGPLLVAGSTVEGEEEAVLRAFGALRADHPAARLVIAPRHPERFAAVADLVARSGLACARRTLLPDGRWGAGDVLVLDTLGELAQVYPLATVVFVGGSLVRAGGHNVLEPAVAGRAIVVGPHMENFREIAEAFLAEGALVQVRDAAGLREAVARLFADAGARDALGARAQAIVARNRGALDRTVDALAGLLGQGSPGGGVRPRRWLAPLGEVFGAAGALRARLHAGGILTRQALAGPVISVGNLAVGGRGKTPLVKRVATMLRDSGRRVAVLSRGYGGTARSPLLVADGESVLASADRAGDEPVMLARSLPGVIVAVARRRADAGRLVEARFGPCVHVLDDGFQHLGLARALDLVAIEAEDLTGRPMPAGALRERPSALARADLVLLSARNRAPLPPGLDPARTLRWQRRSLGFFSAGGHCRPMPPRAFVLSAIAAPGRLLADLAAMGCRVVGQALFRDHHRFTARELRSAAAAAAAAGADAVVTTEKDAVRLEWTAAGPPLVIHRMDAVLEDEARLREILLRAAGGA